MSQFCYFQPWDSLYQPFRGNGAEAFFLLPVKQQNIFVIIIYFFY